MSDVQDGIRKRFDLKRRWKVMMRSHLPDYRLDSGRIGHVCFRKRPAQGLDGALLIKKIFLSGFGKSLKHQPDFPGARFADWTTVSAICLP